MQIAREGYQRINNDVRDYTCVLIKREQIDGKMRGPERIFAKVRHEQVEDGEVASPFSVYMKFEAPAAMRGREVLFVSGRDDDRFLVRKGGSRLPFSYRLPQTDKHAGHDGESLSDHRIWNQATH